MKYGVIGTENAWFASYLRNIMQFCRVNGMPFGLDEIDCGVPQGFCPLGLMILIVEFHKALVLDPHCV